MCNRITATVQRWLLIITSTLWSEQKKYSEITFFYDIDFKESAQMSKISCESRLLQKLIILKVYIIWSNQVSE